MTNVNVNTDSDLNILFCYNQEKLGAIKRANCIQKQIPKEIEVHTIPVQEIQDIDDEYTHVILDKTTVNTPIEQEYEQKSILTNCHRERYQKLDVNEMLVYDYIIPYAICRYNLQYPYEQQYKYIGPLVKDIQPKLIEEKDKRLLVLSGHTYLFELAKYIVENVYTEKTNESDIDNVKWTIVTKTIREYKILKELNNYGHDIVHTNEIEPLLADAKYVVHYGSHQLTHECIKANCVQLIIPPPYSRYYFQHAYRVNEFIIGSMAFDFFRKVSVDRKYRIIRSIRCNYRSYRHNLNKYRERLKNENRVITCTLPMIFTQNSKT